MNDLVYCDYKENTDNTVKYAFGGDIDDITGILVFHFKDDMIEIAKEPDVEPAPIRHIKRLYGIQRKNFKNGVFKKKISYES